MDDWEIVGDPLLDEDESTDESKEDESKADKILESPIELVPHAESIVKQQVIVPLAKKYIKKSLVCLLTSDKFWLNAVALTMKSYGDMDWRINCVCITVNASIILLRHRKLIYRALYR